MNCRIANRILLLLIVISIFSAGRLQQCAWAQRATPLSPEDVLGVREFGQLMPTSWSFDGTLLAFGVKENRRAKSIDIPSLVARGIPPWVSGTDVSVLNVHTGEEINLTGGIGDNWLPSWSPTESNLAFLSDRDDSGQAKIWIWNARSGRLKKLTDVSIRGNQIDWTPDGRKIIIAADLQKSYGRDLLVQDHHTSLQALVTRNTNVTVYDSSGGNASSNQRPVSDAWDLDTEVKDLISIDTSNGHIDTLVRHKRVATYLPSPDGRTVAYTLPKRFEKAGSQQILFDIVVVNLSTKAERVIANDIRLDYDGTSFSWSPAGTQLAFYSGGAEEKVFDCYVVDVGFAVSRNITNFLPLHGRPREKSAVPLWDAQGKNLYISRDGMLWRASSDGRAAASVIAKIPSREITRLIPRRDALLWTLDGERATIVVAHDEAKKQDGIYRIDLVTGTAMKLLESAQCYVCANTEEAFTVTKDGQCVAYFVEDAQHDRDLWMSSPDFRRPQRLTHLNPQFDKYVLGQARLIDWLSDDGERLQGALLLPAGYQEGRSYPLVVWVYGGSLLSDHFNRFALGYSGPFNVQLLATRGYAVLLPDAPIHPGTPMIDLTKTILPGINRVIDLGIANASKIAVVGHSFGGYSTLALITQTNRFKAAIAIDGFADLFADYGEMGESGEAFATSTLEGGRGFMGGTPWQYRDRYLENSPIFYLDKVATPLLIIHGMRDSTVAPFLGDEIFVGLRRLGKEVRLAKYTGEGHSPLYWAYGNQLDLCNRMLDWLSEHLEAEEQARSGNEHVVVSSDR